MVFKRKTSSKQATLSSKATSEVAQRMGGNGKSRFLQRRSFSDAKGQRVIKSSKGGRQHVTSGEASVLPRQRPHAEELDVANSKLDSIAMDGVNHSDIPVSQTHKSRKRDSLPPSRPPPPPPKLNQNLDCKNKYERQPDVQKDQRAKENICESGSNKPPPITVPSSPYNESFEKGAKTPYFSPSTAVTVDMSSHSPSSEDAVVRDPNSPAVDHQFKFVSAENIIDVEVDKSGIAAVRQIRETGTLMKRDWYFARIELRGPMFCIYQPITNFRKSNSNTVVRQKKLNDNPMTLILRRFAMMAISRKSDKKSKNTATVHDVSKSAGACMQYTMYLAGCKVEEMFHYTKKKFVFRISTPKGYEILISPDTLEESMDWIEVLRKISSKCDKICKEQETIKESDRGKTFFSKRKSFARNTSGSGTSLEYRNSRRKLIRHYKDRPTLEEVKTRGIFKATYFGMHLDEYHLSTKNAVPLLFSECIKVIDAEGLSQEGLYRLSGSATTIQKLRILYNDTGDAKINLTDPKSYDHNIHVVTGLLKMFLRELAEPLMTFALYDLFLNIGVMEEEEDRVPRIKELIEGLSDAHYYTAKALFEHLERVHEKAAENKMHDENLALLFSQGILQTQKNVIDSMVDTPYLCRVTLDLIRFHRRIFMRG